MPIPISAGDQLTCKAGSAPAKLKVVRSGCTLDGNAAATVEDAQVGTNIPSMGTCQFLTAKASGTPTPCVPRPQGWTGPPCGFTLDGVPILTSDYTCPCGEGGVIQVAPAGNPADVS